MTDSSQGAKKARTLLYDLETSPNLAYIWGKYEQDALGEFVKERQIISFAYKWLDEKQVFCHALPDFPSYKTDPENNRDLILKLHSVMSEADIVVGHNIMEFDDKMANADFLKHGLKPPSPHRVVDTLKFARNKFRFNSNKLDDIGALLKLGRKRSTGGFKLWSDCMRGDAKAWAKMRIYNCQDVVLLEKIYLRLRPWMMNHPDVNALDRNDGCPVCRSSKLESRGFSIFSGGRRPRFQCKDCGKWSTGVVQQGKWTFRSRA